MILSILTWLRANWMLALVIAAFGAGYQISSWRSDARALSELQSDLGATVEKMRELSEASRENARKREALLQKIEDGSDAVRRYVQNNDTCVFSGSDISVLNATDPRTVAGD